MQGLSDFVIRSAKKAAVHPFTHIAITCIPDAESAQAVFARPDAHMALTLANKGPIVARTCRLYSSSDLWLLAVHGLTRHVNRRADGAALVEISHKGRDVLRMIAERAFS
jgi:hypothetical protein